MSRPRATSLDPRWFEDGSIGEQTAHDGGISALFADDNPIAESIHALVELLEDPYRSAVQMCVMEGISYREAATLYGQGQAADPAHKSMERWAQEGVRRIAEWVGNSPALTQLLGGDHE